VPAQTLPSSQKNNSLFQFAPGALLPHAPMASGLQHIGVRIRSRGHIGFEPQRDSNSSASELRNITAKMSKRIAHFALDIARKRSVSGWNGGPILIGSQSKAHKSSPPPAPVGLRGVAVVQRDECTAAIERN
jgi:hypothetical protein